MKYFQLLRHNTCWDTIRTAAVMSPAVEPIGHNDTVKLGDSRGRSTSFISTKAALKSFNRAVSACVCASAWPCVCELATLRHTLSMQDSHQLHLTLALLAPSNSVTIREAGGGGSCAAAPGPSHRQAEQREACHASLHFFSLFIYESLERVPLSSLHYHPLLPSATLAAARGSNLRRANTSGARTVHVWCKTTARTWLIIVPTNTNKSNSCFVVGVSWKWQNAKKAKEAFKSIEQDTQYYQLKWNFEWKSDKHGAFFCTKLILYARKK